VTTTSKILVGLVAFIGSLTVVLIVQASAHCAAFCGGEDAYYPKRWKADHHTGLTINWKFISNFPGGAFRTRLTEAAGRWNNLGQPMNFNFNGERSAYTRNCSALTNPE
jgi:hypothetical protein